jgi:CRISPR-associated protein Cmr1
MFLGGADQNAQLRAAPFKGLLRYWWRIANGCQFNETTELYEEESKLFGSPDEKQGKSRVTIQVEPGKELQTSKDPFRNPGNVKHPEVGKNGTVNPLGYLAGMGLIQNASVKYRYFVPGGRFRIFIVAKLEDITPAVILFEKFAAAGSRSRNGWGSLAVDGRSQSEAKAGNFLQSTIKPFAETLAVDYPHCLGADKKGLLLWKTRNAAGSWEDCMRNLAEIYIQTRLALNIKGNDRQDRHLLGYPVTHHSVSKWQRHASGLRLFIRKPATGSYRGYILHVPHLFSKKMWDKPAIEQERLWKNVHAKLDALAERALLEELS